MSYISDIADAVWEAETRTLDSEGVAALGDGYIDAIGYAVWTYGARHLGKRLIRRPSFGIVGIPLRGRGPYEKPSPAARIDWQHQLAQGMVAAWDMRLAGARLLDKAKSSAHGTVVGGVSSGCGPHGQTSVFDGAAGSYVLLSNEPAFDFTATSSFSICAWCTPALLAGSTRMLFNKWYDGTRAYYYAIGADGRQHIYNTGTGAGIGYFGTTYDTALGVVRFVSVTIASLAGAFYRNGVSDGSFTSAGLVANNMVPRIGADQGGNSPFSGSIDLLTVYGRALNPTEIAQLHYAPYQMFWEPGRRAIFVPMETGGRIISFRRRFSRQTGFWSY